jgi:hypothetical protein
VPALRVADTAATTALDPRSCNARHHRAPPKIYVARAHSLWTLTFGREKGVRMSNDWMIYVVVGSVVLLMFRLDRLGKQLEAVCANIKSELAPSEDRRREIFSE